MIPPLRRSASAVVLLLLAGCSRDAADRWRGTLETRGDGVVVVRNPEQGVWREGEGWTLEEDLRIGMVDGRGPKLLRAVAAVEVDGRGRVWVLERAAKELRVFDPQGRWVRTVGRAGGGDGELGDPVGLAWAPDGTLWVADAGNARFTVFDTAGLFVNTHPRSGGAAGFPWRAAFGADGLLYEVTSVEKADGPRAAVLRYDAGMEPLDTLLLPAAAAPPADTAAAPPVALNPDGSVWIASGGGYRLVRLRFTRDTARVVERSTSSPPGQSGALLDVMVDSAGGFWARPVLPAGDSAAAFDVFDAEGRHQGRVPLPGGIDPLPLPILRGGALYGVTRDATGALYVVRLRVRTGG